MRHNSHLRPLLESTSPSAIDVTTRDFAGNMVTPCEGGSEAYCGGTAVDEFRRDVRPSTSLFEAFSITTNTASAPPVELSQTAGGFSVETVLSSGAAPSSVGDTVSGGDTVITDLRRDVRPPTSLFGALAASITFNSGKLSTFDSAEVSSDGTLHLEHFSVLSREDGTPWELGRGAMGVTYKALDTRLHCHVALKSINAELLARSTEARDRFLREARSAARLRHPNIASVFHLGETPDGRAFYAMEFIEGETLDARVRRRGPLAVSLALEVGIEVSRALIAAAQHDLIHRDLKPANLMMVAGAEDAFLGASKNPDTGSSFGTRGEAGEAMVKVIDFGLAKVAADNGPATRADAFLGTPQFASPEQFSDNDAAADARSDIYSLGVTLWFLLTGKLPFPGRTAADVRTRQLAQELPTAQLDAARVPAPVAALLKSMLATDPADRPQTPYALIDALRRCRAQVTAATPPAARIVAVPFRRSPAARAIPPADPLNASKSSLMRVLVIATAIGAVGAAILWALHSPNAAPASRSAGIATHAATPVASAAPAAIVEKSVAALPVESSSAEKENAHGSLPAAPSLATVKSSNSPVASTASRATAGKKRHTASSNGR